MVGTLQAVTLCFVLAAVGVSLASQSKPPGTPKQRVAKSDSGSGAQNSDTASKDAGNFPNVTVVVKPDESKDDENIAIQRKLAHFTLCLVVVGFIQAVILTATVWVLRSQITTSRHIERAWVFVTIGELPPFTSDPSTIAFMWIKPTIQNYGRTPARLTKVVARYQTMPMSGLPPQALPAKPEYPADQTATIEGKDILLPPNIASQPINVPVTPEQLTAARRGEVALYIHGFVSYLDTVGEKSHTTRFCYIYWAQSGFSPDPTGFAIAGNTPSAYIGAT
jgi:hypothetical protein